MKMALDHAQLPAPETEATSDAPSYRPLRPGPGRSRTSVAADQRTRINAAMIDLVGKGGYEAVNVRKLTTLARVSTGTFYVHFKGVDDCLLKVHRACLERICRRVTLSRDPRLGRGAQAEASIRTLLVALTESPAATRLVLSEVFAAGPVALERGREMEARLQAALRASLDRRGDRFSDATATWITAGILHWARTNVGCDPPAREPDSIESMIRWGERVASGAGAFSTARVSSTPRAEHPGLLSAVSASDPEEDLLLRAAIRLALNHGYRKLTARTISAQAGLKSSALDRHFDGTEGIFLDLVGRISARLFGAESTAGPDRSAHIGDEPVGQVIAAVTSRILTDGAAARLVLIHIIDPGREGLTRKSGLVNRIAASWSARLLASEHPKVPAVEAAVAGLWGVLAANATADMVGELPDTASTLTRLFQLAARTPSGPARR